MKITLKLILLTLCIFNVLSCQNTKQSNSASESINIDKISLKNIDIEDLFQNISFLSIDNEDILMPGVAKIINNDNIIYISDGFILYMYDSNGKITGQINKKGKAKGEYLEITDFQVNSDKIIILDRNKRKILTYNKRGEFVSDIDLNVFASTLGVINDSLLVINNDYSTYEDSQKGKLSLININSKEISYFGEYNKNKTNYLHIMGGSNFYSNKEGLLFYEKFNRNVYKIDNGEMKEVININLPNTPKDDYYNNKFEDVADFINNFTQNNYASGISNLYYSKSKVIFKFFYNQSEYYCLYDRHQNKVDFMGELFLYNDIKINNIYFDNGKAMASISAYRLLDAMGKNKKINDLVKKYKITETSSPLLLRIDNIK